MTLSDFCRAMLAEFAIREAGEGASHEQMRAVALCIRCRVRQGWHDGNWIRAVEESEPYRANLPGPRVRLDPTDRRLQRFIRDVDDIYFAARTSSGQLTADGYAGGGEMDEALKDCCFWMRADEPVTPWFRENILDNPEKHPMRAQMGLMMFYE